ncbi:hypothetical protein BJY00DRAFT_46811 [Aspergillus carlsbadensis]|nr:hypothetical protein BJY00DRAFT_46811 [Aspergillus carlsbadensis]
MEEDEILRVYRILHLVFHRNRNQHGRTKWWKWLSMLKRTVWNLAQSRGNGQGNPHPAEFYRKYLAECIVPNCYVAFSGVVADVQFSPLGTVLLATLARISNSLGIDKDFKLRRQTEVASVHHPLSRPAISKGKVDVGQTLSRCAAGVYICPGSEAQHAPSPILVDPGLATSSRPNSAEKPDASEQKNTKTKKKKRKKNAIDDLFDGLL